MVMLLNLRNAVQSAKSILPDVENKLSIGIRNSKVSLQIYNILLPITLLKWMSLSITSINLFSTETDVQ